MMTKYHLTWSSKHKAVRRVEQAAYVILMPTLTPHNASSDRASHRYFHSSQWVASDGRLIMGDHNPCVAYVRCGIFTRRIFASAQPLGAQRLRVLPALAHRSRLCCVCSTNMCLPLAKYQHPSKHARCAYHAGINGCGLDVLTS